MAALFKKYKRYFEIDRKKGSVGLNVVLPASMQYLYKMKITNGKTITLDDFTSIPCNSPLAVLAFAQIGHMA